MTKLNQNVMKKFNKYLLITFTLLAAGCNFGGEETCDLAPGLTEQRMFNKVPASSDHKWCDVIPYGESLTIGARYFASGCATSKEEVWTFPEGTTDDTHTPETTFRHVRIVNDGEICLYIKTEKGNTEKFCRTVSVASENLWTNVPVGIISPRTRMISMVINGVFYAGFGVEGGALNLNYRKDWFMMVEGTRQFMPLTPNISDVNFTAIAGFAIGNTGYIVGNNSKVYSFNPNTIQWTELSKPFPENIYTALLSNRWDKDDPVISMAANGKGYIGLGKTRRWIEFDPATHEWTDRAEYTGTKYQFPLHFVQDDKCYVGDKIYDPTNDTWSDSPLASYNDKLGHWLPINGELYYRDGIKTWRIDISNGAKAEQADAQLDCFGDPPSVNIDHYGVSGVVGNRGYVVTNRIIENAETQLRMKSYVFQLKK